MDEGPVFAMCMTSQGNQATLNQWISGLQQDNPILGQVPTLFRLDPGPRELQEVTDTWSGHQHSSDFDGQPEEETDAEVQDELRRRQRMTE